jgi:hypothetical protein
MKLNYTEEAIAIADIVEAINYLSPHGGSENRSNRNKSSRK